MGSEIVENEVDWMEIFGILLRHILKKTPESERQNKVTNTKSYSREKNTVFDESTYK